MEAIIMFKGQLWSGFAVSVAIYSGLSFVFTGSVNAVPCIRVLDPATGEETCVTPFEAWPKEGLGACGFSCVKHLDDRKFIKVARLFDSQLIGFSVLKKPTSLYQTNDLGQGNATVIYDQEELDRYRKASGYNEPITSIDFRRYALVVVAHGVSSMSDTSLDITRGIVFNLEDGGAVLRLGYTLIFADPYSSVAAVITPVEQFILVDRSQLPSPEKLRRIELAVQAKFIGYKMPVGVDYDHFYSINYSYKPQKPVISPAPSPKPGNSVVRPVRPVQPVVAPLPNSRNSAVRPVRPVQPAVIRRVR
jgi:hypothetical protein